MQQEGLRSYIETSAASGQGVEAVLQNVLTEVLHSAVHMTLPATSGQGHHQQTVGRRQTVHSLMPSSGNGTGHALASTDSPGDGRAGAVGEETDKEPLVEIELAGRRKSFDYAELTTRSNSCC